MTNDAINGGFIEGPVMIDDADASDVAGGGPAGGFAKRTASRRNLLRAGGLMAAVGAVGVANWATRSAVSPVAAQAAGTKKIVWSKNAHRVYLVDGSGAIARAMPCLGNDWKTPNGSYSIWSYSRAISYVDGRKVYLPDFAPFYRRPGQTWNIGFHAIPVWADDPNSGEQIHDDSLLGGSTQTGGCIRLSSVDASYLHSWAPVGTTVVVQDEAYNASSSTSSSSSASGSTGTIAPSFPTGLRPNRSTPSAIPLQRQLKKAGFMPSSVAENANYGPATQKAVAAFHNRNTQFRTSSYDIAIGPEGWAFLFTHY